MDHDGAVAIEHQQPLMLCNGSSIPPRVVPLLCHDLKTTHGSAQHMHLVVLLDRWADVVKVKVTLEDAEELLVVLFVIVNGGMKPSERETAQKHAEAGRRVAFEILWTIFTQQNGHTRAFVQALHRVMDRLRCNDATYYARQEPLENQDDYAAMRRRLEQESNCERKNRRQAREAGAHDLLAQLKALRPTLAASSTPTDASTDTAAAAAAAAAAAGGDAPLVFNNVGTVLEATAGPHALEPHVASFIAGKMADSAEVHDLLAATALRPPQERLDALAEILREVLAACEGERLEDTKCAEQQQAEDALAAVEGARRRAARATAEANASGGAAEAEGERSVAVPGDIGAFFPPALLPEGLHMDEWLAADATRAFAVQLLRAWDLCGVNARYFLSQPTIHLYLPTLYSRREKVYRDFVCCPQRPKGAVRWGPLGSVHVKTNIKKKSDIMYRFLVEGYNYGTNSIVHCDLAGYAHRNWEKIGKGAMEDAGWPEGWGADLSCEYMSGCSIEQYYSQDGHVVIQLQSRSFFCIGFSVSAWLVVHEFGAGFHLTATVHHQTERL